MLFTIKIILQLDPIIEKNNHSVQYAKPPACPFDNMMIYYTQNRVRFNLTDPTPP